MCSSDLGKTLDAVRCAHCKSALAAPKQAICQDCGQPKKSPLGERCRGCAAKAAKGRVPRSMMMDGSSLIDPAKYDRDDPLAKVLAHEYGGALEAA